MRMDDKILIIGIGSIGKRHLGNLEELGYKNLALCDPNIDQINQLPSNLPKYKNLLLALKYEKPSVCFVCSPTHLHLKNLKECLNQDSHVFVEKPLSFSIKGIDKVISLSKKKNKKVMVACNWRFHEVFKNLKDIIKRKTYGQILSASIEVRYFLPEARGNNWKKSYAVKQKGGGVTLDTGSHIINYLNDLFGEIVDIKSFKSPFHPLKTDVDEQAVIFLRHKNNIICDIYMDYICREPIHLVCLNTTKGIVSADFRNNEIAHINKNKEKLIFKGKKDLNEMYLDELRHFFAALEDKAVILQSLDQAKTVVRLLTNS